MQPHCRLPVTSNDRALLLKTHQSNKLAVFFETSLVDIAVSWALLKVPSMAFTDASASTGIPRKLSLD